MRRRILQATLLAVAVTAVVLGLPLGYTALKVIEDTSRFELSSRAQQIAATFDDQITNTGSIDILSVRLAVPPTAQLIAHLGSKTYVYGHDPGVARFQESVPMVQDGTVTLAEPSDPVRTEQFQVAGLVLLLVVLSAGTGMIVAMVTAQRLADPLRHVAARAARLGAGDFRPDPRRHQVPELDRVSDSLDASGAALAHLVQRERELVGDVSHQLRSRLTALHLRLEALAVVDDAEIAEEASAALDQARQLSQVLDDLLAAATAARAHEAEPVDISRALSLVAEEWHELFRAEGRSLRLRVPEGLHARATPARLREAIGVLLDNAFRHGEGVVTLAARQGNATVVVEVSDNGPGVPDELVPHVFARGFSGRGSSGVGLALARALVEADGGRLELSRSRPAVFEVFLRIARADEVIGVPWKIEPTPR
jgi:signal transduction histidine kinase